MCSDFESDPGKEVKKLDEHSWFCSDKLTNGQRVKHTEGEEKLHLKKSVIFAWIVLQIILLGPR